MTRYLVMILIVVLVGLWARPVNATQGDSKAVASQIDGAIAPDKIPDSAAYSIFFRILANQNRTASQKAAIRAYVRNIISEQCKNCGVALSDSSETQIDSLIAVAKDYCSRAHVIDIALTELLRQSNPGDALQLRELQQRKDQMLTNIVNSLLLSLGSQAAADKVRTHIQNMKRNMKLASSQ